MSSRTLRVPIAHACMHTRDMRRGLHSASDEMRRGLHSASDADTATLATRTTASAFAPFVVEEGGRIGTDAEALVDAIARAGSTDLATWLPTKTFCMSTSESMRAIATTTAKAAGPRALLVYGSQ